MSTLMDTEALALLRLGAAIPACPLALNARRQLDERRQRALIRYYTAAGAGGVAVGVHTTQFAIRDSRHGLFEPVLRLALEELERADARQQRRHVRIGGICGPTAQAVGEAELLRGIGYDAGLLSLAALKDVAEDALIAHCRAVAAALPVIGFYLQPSVGGRVLSLGFWRRFVELENVVAIKVAPFNRYQTHDVLRAVAESGRDNLALYTGNDDHIVLDLLTPHTFPVAGGVRTLRFVGGLLGHWAVWTRRAVELQARCREFARSEAPVPQDFLRKAHQITEMNAALFDAANGFRGCIAGVHEVLRRQGLLEGIWCLDPEEGLSSGQVAELDRVCAAYPHLVDDDFVREHVDEWLG